MVKIILVMGLIIVLLGALSFILFIILRDTNKTLKDLKHDNKLLEENISYLFKYSEIINKIKKERTDIEDEIKTAENTDEIINILNSIIKSNNDRMCDD